MKTKIKILSLILITIFASILSFSFMGKTVSVANAEKSAFVKEKLMGTLSGVLSKQADGSVNFNGSQIASADENLSQMYIMLQGAGGSGGFGNKNGICITGVYHSKNLSGGGASGAFIMVLVKLDAIARDYGNVDIKITSGLGGTPGTITDRLNPHVTTYIEGRKAEDSEISIENVGSITAKGGESAEYATGVAKGGEVVYSSKVANLSDYLEIKVKKNGKSGDSETSHVFTVTMSKKGLLTSKTYNTMFGGKSNTSSGGGSSAYARGGNGANNGFWGDLILYPGNAEGYGAGGGGAIYIMFNKAVNADDIEFSRVCTGGDGGAGFVEIWG